MQIISLSICGLLYGVNKSIDSKCIITLFGVFAFEGAKTPFMKRRVSVGGARCRADQV